jgi:hypothetical protein
MSESRTRFDGAFVGRVLLKACVLFVIFNLVFALLDPMPAIGRLSLYNTVLPGRQRLPFGENPESYNLSLFQLDAMFASHEVTVPKAPQEYRVLVIGDSSVWGILLQPDETLAGCLNAGIYTTADGRFVRAYNLGYPTIDVSKDLLILSYAMRYEPDLIIWPVTLEALPDKKQITSPLVQHHPQQMRDLIDAYNLDIDPNDPDFADQNFWDRTLVGSRRTLADVLRLNLYGIMWASTGIDQYYPDEYTPRAEDLSPDEDFYGLARPLQEDDLALDILAAGVELADGVPVVFVNEPMFVSNGENSDIRYNFYYPRWAYDDYRQIMSDFMDKNGWLYLDLWDAISDTEFTNSAIHLTPEGSAEMAQLIASALQWEEPGY